MNKNKLRGRGLAVLLLLMANATAWGQTSVIVRRNTTSNQVKLGTEFEVNGLRYCVISANSVEVVTNYGNENSPKGKFTVPSSVSYKNKSWTVSKIRKISYCEELEEVEIPNSVVEVCDYAFGDKLNKLAKVTIPSSVRKIGERALKGEIYVDPRNQFYSSIDGVLYDKSHSKLIYCPRTKTEISIPQTVSVISGHAFSYCKELKEIILPPTVKSIGEYAFSGCSGLASMELPDMITTVPRDAFNGCSNLVKIKFPAHLTSIGEQAFCECGKLEEAYIPSSVRTIDKYAFYECRSLKSVNIPSGITEISANVFSGCESIQSITLPSSITKISESAFWGCKQLTGIVIPESVTYIGPYAFDNCERITSIQLPPNLTSLGSSTFSSSVFSSTGITEITIPEGIKTLGGALQQMHKLVSVHLPLTLEKLREDEFLNDYSLLSIIIPASVSYIDATAFRECDKLVISIEEGNQHYVVKDSCIYNKSLTKLVVVPRMQKTLVIPDTVEEIARKTLWYSNLTSLSIPSHLMSKLDRTLVGCKGLEFIMVRYPNGTTEKKNIEENWKK